MKCHLVWLTCNKQMTLNGWIKQGVNIMTVSDAINIIKSNKYSYNKVAEFCNELIHISGHPFNGIYKCCDGYIKVIADDIVEPYEIYHCEMDVWECDETGNAVHKD